MNKSEKIAFLEEKLKLLKQDRKSKVKEIEALDTEINWIKIQLEELAFKKY
jgi:hypothetical protein